MMFSKNKKPHPDVTIGESAQVTDMEERNMHYDQALEDFVMEAGKQGRHYKSSLFRIVKDAYDPGKKAKWAFLHSWTNEVPDYESIGKLYGAGEYRVNVMYNRKEDGKRTSTTIDIVIDPSFGRTQQDVATQAALGDSVAAPQVPQLQPMVDMFQSCIKAITEIATAQAARPATPENPNLMEINSAMGKVISQNWQQQQKLISRMSETFLPPEEPETDKGIGDYITELLRGAIEHFGDKLLKGTPIVRDFYKQQIKASPQYEQVLENPEAYRQAYDTLIQQEPKERVDKILAVLDIPTPDEMRQEAPAPAAEEQGE